MTPVTNDATHGVYFAKIEIDGAILSLVSTERLTAYVHGQCAPYIDYLTARVQADRASGVLPDRSNEVAVPMEP